MKMKYLISVAKAYSYRLKEGYEILLTPETAQRFQLDRNKTYRIIDWQDMTNYRFTFKGHDLIRMLQGRTVHREPDFYTVTIQDVDKTHRPLKIDLNPSMLVYIEETKQEKQNE